jgi:hypothetical protein
MDAVEKLSQNFSAQLKQTNEELAQHQQQIEMLTSRREQLKGAIYALSAVGEQAKADKAAAEAAAAAPVPAAPAADATAPNPAPAADQATAAPAPAADASAPTTDAAPAAPAAGTAAQ